MQATTERVQSVGEKGRATDILAAIRTLKQVERQGVPATPYEVKILESFGGFGPVALSIFPHAITGKWKSGWQKIGEELRSLLTDAEYESARRTTFNAFYTSTTVISFIHRAISRLGVPNGALVLEPGCGTGKFISDCHRFLAVEMDDVSGRIARAVHPSHEVRIENFRDTKLPTLDAVVGNVPFADIKMDYQGQKFSLHDYFIAKSVDALRPNGVLATVTSRYTLDKSNGSAREFLAARADFVGAIRLPSGAFRSEGTEVVTDILFLRRRADGASPAHADDAWLTTVPVRIDGVDPAAKPTVNGYFINHPDMLLGDLCADDSLYSGGYSVLPTGDLVQQLSEAVGKLPAFDTFDASPAPVFADRPGTQFRPRSEGSFLIRDGGIYQVVDGQVQPVVYGGSQVLISSGALVGRRFAALIELRDLARRVLRTQNDGLPTEERERAREDLNHAYDQFVAEYGSINKTTLSDTSSGATIRRMPNLVKFREDPDAMLVMALEEYDETTDKASKAAIMLRDVVGHREEILSVTSAQNGLLACLNRYGVVDVDYIARLYRRTPDEVVAELGDLLYFDPESRKLETVDAYLSGNVRAKLRAAEASGLTRNIRALQSVQPEDLLPGDIDVNLGASWVPTTVVEQFAKELLRCDNGYGDPVTVSHVAKDALWVVVARSWVEKSVAATADYGTSRANGVSLLEMALNMKSPVVYDTIHDGEKEEKIVNHEQTLAAREKQRVIKDKFRSWIFADHDRAEKLVRIYNDLYNNLRQRAFDGSHLDFPGMSQAFTLRPHQCNAVWRGMCSGNTLLAHVVGAGKTAVMAATAMKMRQAGLIKKPLVVVPNHLLEQFAREFQHVYPNAHLLVATKDDFTRERRKFLTARIASGDWDAITVTHSSFERIGMSADYQSQFLQEQISEYAALIGQHDAGDYRGSARNIIKVLEKRKAAYEVKLNDLLAKDKKDDGLVFDELGVDHLLVDEFQYFKNLETASKMERVAGVQTGGSERAFDMLMKTRYLHQRHPGHGITAATGTPISNSLCELFTMQRYLDPDGLRDRGIEHFDAWAATFGEVVDSLEISPDGKTLKSRSRFSKFVNLPELQSMFRVFADVQTADMLKLPCPDLWGGKAQVVSCPMSRVQVELQQSLVRRYERIRTTKVDPREDNALAITTDGRKLSLDARMLTEKASVFPEGKIVAMVERIVEIHAKTAALRSTQMVFLDMGVNPTSWGYCPYEEITDMLVAAGIPKREIAAVGEADSDTRKRVLFEQVRAGQVRVLLGSTTKMGTGTNVQKRLIAMHELDAPWKPAEVEQREGRILRQGNDNPVVTVYRYVTAGSFDAFMWQTLQTKARFIAQIMTGDNAIRRADDVGSQELSYAEVKAIASGNPAVLTLAETDAELQRLAVMKRTHMDQQYTARRSVKSLPDTIQMMADRLAGLKVDRATLQAHVADKVVIDGVVALDPMVALRELLEQVPKVSSTRNFVCGVFRGLKFGLTLHASYNPEVYLSGHVVKQEVLNSEGPGAKAVFNGLNRLVSGYEHEVAYLTNNLALSKTQLADYKAMLGREFPLDDYQAEMATLRDRLQHHLASPGEAAVEETAATVREIKALRKRQAAATGDVASSPRSDKKQLACEEPLTLRILRQQGQ